MKAVDIAGLHVEASTGAPIVVLREQDAPHRILPIFIGGAEAAAIALALSGQSAPRPLTHDLMAAIVETVDVHVDRVVVTEVRDGTFHAELTVSGPGRGDHRLDSRPSDAIALALRLHAPVFVDEAVLDEAGALLAGAGGASPGEAEIEQEVAAFRSLLDELDPADFAGPDEPN